MRDDLVSLKVLVVTHTAQDRDLLREGAVLVSVPIDLVEAGNVEHAAEALRRSDIDLVLLDGGFPDADKETLVRCARTAAKPPFVVLLAGAGSTMVDGVDAVMAKPRDNNEALQLAERCARVRVPSRVLVVDDSSTMRSIVRKILLACRFPLNIIEAGEGNAALEMACGGSVDVVFLDYNMPGLDGLATLRELKRAKPELVIVLMTSTEDRALAARALEAGAAAFLRKPFYPSDVDAVLRAAYGLAPLKTGG